MSCLMGLDLGTSSVRAMIVREDGTRLALEGESYDVIIPRPCFAEQDTDGWYAKGTACIRRAVAASGVSPDEIKAISFSGHMHGLVCVDAGGAVVRPAIIWQDQRSAAEIAEIYSRFGAEFVAKNTQNSIATGFLIASLYWLKKHEPENYARTKTVMLPKDYIKYRLCGRIATDYSDAAGSLAFDNVNLRWAAELIDALGLDLGKFPECLPSTEPLGTVTEAASRDCGLSTSTLVVGGGADQPMQAIGTGIVSDGVFSTNIGTGGQVTVSMGTPVFDSELRTTTFAHVMPGRWYVMGAVLNSGGSLKWFANNVLGDGNFAALSEGAAATDPMGGGLVFLPYLTGERTPHLDAEARAVFFGLNLGHTRYHMVRAVMEGVVFAFRDSLEIITGMGLPCKRLIASGGGAKSDLWLQMQADILERDVGKSLSDEQACLGAAMTAGVGAGVFADFQEAAARLTKLSDVVFSPNPKNFAVYREGYRIYRDLYARNRDLFKAAANLPEPETA